ncbi:Uncharacterised protein [Mycobacterium tuberculosis]|nr:Uncharacterised protein [Mycobacterium tuberculosis]
MHNLVATILGQVNTLGGADQQTDLVQTLHYLNNARDILLFKGVHGKLTAIIGEVRAVLCNVGEALILETAHIVLQFGVGVSARHDKVDSLRLQAG